jgi:hypothetical protein
MNQLAQNRDQWWALVNTVMNLWVPQKAGEFLDWLSDYKLLKDSVQLSSYNNNNNNNNNKGKFVPVLN